MHDHHSIFRSPATPCLRRVSLLGIFLIFGWSVHGQGVKMDVKKIWDHAAHNAFTDLIRYQGRFYCIFRESSAHVPQSHEADGKIRILESKNGKKWHSFALLEKAGYDLRDPSLTVTPDGKLMALMGGSVYEQGTLTGMVNQVSFLDRQSHQFSAPTPVAYDSSVVPGRNWLWRIAWNKGVAYGVIYSWQNNTASLHLVSSKDGIHYSLVTDFPIEGRPNETAMQFNDQGDLYILVRREDQGQDGLLGKSTYPYKQWKWAHTGFKLGGPHFIWNKDGALLVGTRTFPGTGKGAHTGILTTDASGKFRPLLEFPSGGDTSYPGMWIFHGRLFVSYYSSHEGKTSIYLARIPLKALNKAIGAHAPPSFD